MLESKVKRLRETSRPTLRSDGSVELDGIDFSAADMYLKCPEQYRIRYIEGKRAPPAVSLTEGTGHHKSMEEDNLSKLNKDKALTAAQLTDVFREKFDDDMADNERQCDELKIKFDWGEDSRDRILQRAKVLHHDYACRWTHKFKPVPGGVEKTFVHPVMVRGMTFNMYGQIDLMTKDLLGDYKTSARPKSQKDVDMNLQLTLYSLAERRRKVGFISFVKAVDPFVQYLESERGPSQWMWGLEVLASAVDGIRRGSFPKTNPGMIPTPWWCSDRFCGFWDRCRGKYEK